MYIDVSADGVPLDSVGGVGPDVVDNDGLHPWSGWNPGGKCRVGLSDQAIHVDPIKLAVYSFCTDLSRDGTVNIVDVVLLAPALSAGVFCIP